MIRRPPRSTLVPYTTPLPIWDGPARGTRVPAPDRRAQGGRSDDSPDDARHGRGRDGVRPSDADRPRQRSEEHTSELQSRQYLVCRLLLEQQKIESNRDVSLQE